MPCADCGEWCRRYRWHSTRCAYGPEPAWLYFEVDPEDPEIYWHLHCLPSCQVTRVERTLARAEESLRWAAPAWFDAYLTHWFDRLRAAFTEAVDELDAAWVELER